MYAHGVSPGVEGSCCNVPVSYAFPCGICEVGTAQQRVRAICRGGGALPKVDKGLGSVAGEVIPPCGSLRAHPSGVSSGAIALLFPDLKPGITIHLL